MESPFTNGKAVLEGEWTCHTFRKESFDIFEQRYRCLDTDNIFYTEELDRLNLAQVHNQYRSRHQIPFPQEIEEIRERYGLSASRMSEVLGFGINSYRQYELGEIPSQANAKLIRLAAVPQRFSEFLEDKPWLFSPRQLEKLRSRVRQQANHSSLSSVMTYLWNSHLDPNEFTGFVKPQLDKVAQFVLFFVSRMRPLKTRLNKLLFYADFLHFKETGFSISGCNYRAIPFGPVPSHFHALFGLLEDQGYLRIEEELFQTGHVGERFEANGAPLQACFSDSEWDVMNRVAEAFEGLRTRDLIELSHTEEGWKANSEARELISYQHYAFTLKGL